MIDAIIMAVRHIEEMLNFVNKSKQVYILEDQIAQLSEQINILIKEG